CLTRNPAPSAGPNISASGLLYEGAVCISAIGLS
ncbi:MAG: hypothetical protein ACI853_002014, partial [Paracoccaceae bacterium]